MIRDFFGAITIAGVLGMVSMIFIVLFIGLNHDYVLYEVYNQSVELENQNLSSSAMTQEIEEIGNFSLTLITYADWLWMMFYVGFFVSSIGLAFLSDPEDDFNFLTVLFYGTMTALFLIFIVGVFTDWLSSDILYNLIPNLEGTLPKFSYVYDNIGMFSFVQILLCLFVNQVDFDLRRNNKGSGKNLLGQDEII